MFVQKKKGSKWSFIATSSLCSHLSELNLPLEDWCDPMVQPQTRNGSNIVIRHIFILKITCPACTLLFRNPFTTIHDNFCNDFTAPVTRETLYKVVFSYNVCGFISCLHNRFWKVTFFKLLFWEREKKKSFRLATMAAWVTLPFFVVVLFIARPRCPLKCETNVRHTSETLHPKIHWRVCVSCMWTAMFGLQ